MDQESYELDILIQSRHNKKASKRFFKQLLKSLCYVLRVIITDKLQSYTVAKIDILPDVEHRQHKEINNYSHQPTRQQKKQMRTFKSPKQVQRFLFLHGQLRNLFFAGRYKNPAGIVRNKLLSAFSCWEKMDLQHQCA